MVDIPLVRSESPAFVLTWLALHVIDETSPLQGVTAEAFAEGKMEILVTFTGWDETLAQTIYARQSYVGHELRWNHRFLRCHPPVGGRLTRDRLREVSRDRGGGSKWSSPPAEGGRALVELGADPVHEVDDVPGLAEHADAAERRAGCGSAGHQEARDVREVRPDGAEEEIAAGVLELDVGDDQVGALGLEPVHRLVGGPDRVHLVASPDEPVTHQGKNRRVVLDDEHAWHGSNAFAPSGGACQQPIPESMELSTRRPWLRGLVN